MKILVFVKQVPEITDVKIDPETGNLLREGVASILNPFCEYAVDLALDFRKNHDNVKIVAVSMGPPQAKAALMRCLEMGVDEGILLSDTKFAGADTWATARTLAAAAKDLVDGFDLILVGKQAIDGDTAQVGPEIAECLAIPQITYGVDMEINETKKRIRVRRETEQGYESVEMKLPGLVSVSKGAMIRRVCSFQEILDAREKKLRVVTADDLGLEEDDLGLSGSLTQVIKIFPPSVKTRGEIVDGKNPEHGAKRVIEFLRERNFV